MGLFSAAVTDQINQIAAKSNEEAQKVTAVNTRSMNDDLNQMSKKVLEYFKDSPAILITTPKELHDYIDKCIETGYAGIDTETTGLDRINDWIVGASLYTPGLPECYISMKHLVPLFDTLYKNQLTYEEVAIEFQRLVDNDVKLIFANADFDLAMIYKDLKVDMIPAFYYDVLTAWRCLREDEKDNSLKGLYAKYVKKGQIDPKKFSDFFPPKLFPYAKPHIAALYAANDAKITYELFLWQLPFITKTHAKCQKNHLEKIADLVWNIEFPLVSVCANLHRRGVYLDDSIASTLHNRYQANLDADKVNLAACVQELIDTKDIASNRKRPFRTGSDFNPNSNPHVKYLINELLGSTAKSTGKDILKEINKPATKAVLDVRGDVKLMGTYVDKLPKIVAKDHRVHASFKAIGAATGRMACIEENQLISTEEGLKPIKDIREGERVYCLSDSQKLELAIVLNKWLTGYKECIKVKFQDSFNHDYELICTPDHPIRRGDFSWVQAGELQVGDFVVSHDLLCDSQSISTTQLHCMVTEVTNIIGEFFVYDIEVENHHNFFASNINVHNSADPNMQNIPSRAHDIRHMFRATPEQTETIDLSKQLTNELIEIKLSNFDSILTSNGSTKVKELQKGTTVIMKEDKVDANYKIESIESSKGHSVIKLRRED